MKCRFDSQLWRHPKAGPHFLGCWLWAMALAVFGLDRAGAQMPFYGNYFLHDPGTMIKGGANYFVFGDGQGISGITSSDLRNGWR